MVPFCTASDGGGSTRIPAAFCGLVGFKPTFGRIPHEGVAPSQTSVYGALTTTVQDAARHLDVAAGPDDRDRTTLPAVGACYERIIEELDVAGLRAAWSADLGYAVVDPEVASLAEAAAHALAEAAGLDVVDRPISLTNPMELWLTLGAVDLWHDLEKGMWPERADDFDVLARLAYQSTEGLSVKRIAQLQRAREALDAEVAALYRDIDVLLTPATAIPAFAAEGPLPMEINGQPVFPAMVVPFTRVGNLCWNPAVSVPAGTTADGLPVGLQVMARRHADDVVLRLARVFEQARPWPRHAPLAATPR
jgi:aspartyl-tRNA(Asn)/glutamyl-tRNA(Gln) amidotransferase subunit A